MNELGGKKIAILATDGVERVELEQPRGALYGAGAQTELVSIHSGEIQARHFEMVSAGTFPVDREIADASVDDYDALLLPGGTVNPDQLRMNEKAVGFGKAFVATGKPVAAICHGAWTLVEADVVRGHRFTSWPSVRTDLRNAGPTVVDEEVVIDGQFTTDRSQRTCRPSARRSCGSSPGPASRRRADRRRTADSGAADRPRAGFRSREPAALRHSLIHIS
jgi:protease I